VIVLRWIERDRLGDVLTRVIDAIG
jgi:hypothetical protein